MMRTTTTEVMTVQELAEYLKLDPQTIYRRFRKGELPGVKIGKSIRFKRDVVDGWLRASSHRWGARERAELRQWAEPFARRRGLREKEALAAVRARRRRR
jgi:excisionase family DNA binding protein